LKEENLICPHHNVNLSCEKPNTVLTLDENFRDVLPEINGLQLHDPNKTPEPTLKEKFLNKIKNRKGKISPLKIVGMILMITVYILELLIASFSALPNRKKLH